MNKFIFKDSVYQKLKFLALVLIPAFSTLYFSIGSIWSLPDTTKVIGTLSAIDTFLGVILGLSTKAYNASDLRYDGNLNIMSTDSNGSPRVYSLELNGDPEDILDNKTSIVFKVNPFKP